MDQENLRKEILKAVKILSDASYQSKMWLGGDDKEMSTYEDTICTLFDDLGLEDYLQSYSDKNSIFYQKMLKLEEGLNSFITVNDNILVPDLLVHPDWKEIQKIACSIIKDSENLGSKDQTP